MTAPADRGEEVSRVMEDARFLHEQAASGPADWQCPKCGKWFAGTTLHNCSGQHQITLPPVGPQPCAACGQWHTGRECQATPVTYHVDVLAMPALDRLAAAAERIAAALEHDSLLVRVTALEGEVKRLRIQG